MPTRPATPRAVLLGACLLIGVPLATLVAQTPPPASPPPRPCSSEAYRAFDFWLGTWDVVNPAGAVAGRNVITAGNGGCTITESYTTPGGYAGQSINAYDAPRDRWHQTWTDVSGLLLRLEGTSPQPGVMRLEGTRVDAQGRTVTDRITWTRQEDGSVRQFWEQSLDGGATWQTAFDGMYRRVESGLESGTAHHPQLI
ncbi:MAG: hypothetical protein ABR551_02955 [Gemmatimonadales bacterium]